MIILNKIESIIKSIKNRTKIIWYKLKYGKRLKIGKNVVFRKGFTLYIEKDAYVEIGDKNFFNNYCTIDCMGKIIIGQHNLFGENVKIYDHNHLFNNKNINRGSNYTIDEINIGKENWIGTNVTILRHTNLGNYNVIAAGTVLNKHIDDDNIVSNVGNSEYNIQKIRYKG